jgi:hypothetical protein
MRGGRKTLLGRLRLSSISFRSVLESLMRGALQTIKLTLARTRATRFSTAISTRSLAGLARVESLSAAAEAFLSCRRLPRL